MEKTLFLFSPSASRFTGGIPNTAYYFTKYFSDKYKMICFLNDNENETVNNVVYKVYQGNRIFRTLKELHEYKVFVQQSKDSITICLNWRYAVVPFLCNSKKNRYIVMCHGNDVLPYTKISFRSIFEQFLRKAIVNKAIGICANSNYTMELCRKINKRKKIIVIHPCSGENVNYKHQSENKGFILSVGRLEERKGNQYVIEAMKNLTNDFPHLKLFIAGDGPYKKYLEEYISSLKLNDTCKLIGRISESEKNHLLDTCNLLVMPSFYNAKEQSVEGFGIVYIEANAHGRPVIGTNCGGIPDAIIDGVTGLIVPENDVIKLEIAMRKLLNGDVVIDSTKCKKWAEKHYYTEIMKQYENLFNSLSEKV